MKNDKGIILIFVLFYLQLLTLLGLFSLQMTQIMIKQSHHSWYHYLVIENTREALTMAENNLNKSLPSCIIPVTFTADIISKPLSWWQTSSCAGNFSSFQYYYVVEFLGSDPCALIQTSSQSSSADYFRITIKGMARSSNLILQSTFVVPHIEGHEVCYGTSHSVTPGRQMWRELN